MRTGIKLSADDGRAVDLLLDHGVDGQGAVKKLTRPVGPKRLAAVKKILGRLDAMDAGEPPAGLAARTVAAVEDQVRVRTAGESIGAEFGTRLH